MINDTSTSSLTAARPHDKENIKIIYQPLAKDIAVSDMYVISFIFRSD